MENKTETRLQILDTFSSVRRFSFQEKKSPYLDEAKVNALLDKILDFKANLVVKTNRIAEINEKLEEVTWFNDLDEESLMLLNDLIAASKDLRTSLVRQYIAINILRTKGIAKAEIKEFKSAIDDLKESYEDLESVFFLLPEMPDFVETTKQLTLV